MVLQSSCIHCFNFQGISVAAKATTKAFESGLLHTGDLGVIHPDGYLEHKDRSKDVIISGSENVSSIEVGIVVYAHPDVPEATIVGQPDDY